VRCRTRASKADAGKCLAARHCGFVPVTKGKDGAPLDVLLLLDEPTSVGYLVSPRLIEVAEAEQTEGGETLRNDWLIAVTAESHNHRTQ